MSKIWKGKYNEAKNEEITKLKATNKALLGKKTKSESKDITTYTALKLLKVVDDEIASNLQAIHDSSSSMSDEEKAKLEVQHFNAIFLFHHSLTIYLADDQRTPLYTRGTWTWVASKSECKCTRRTSRIWADRKWT